MDLEIVCMESGALEMIAQGWVGAFGAGNRTMAGYEGVGCRNDYDTNEYPLQ